MVGKRSAGVGARPRSSAARILAGTSLRVKGSRWPSLIARAMPRAESPAKGRAPTSRRSRSARASVGQGHARVVVAAVLVVDAVEIFGV